MQRLLSFVRSTRGRIVQAPGGLGGQCVDLANLYLTQVWRKPEIQRNAVDWQHATIQGMTWEPNGPANSPPAGSLVVWGPNAAHEVGANGHIAISLTADSMDLISLDQNWPDGSPCALTLHDYGGVIGWFRPAG